MARPMDDLRTIRLMLTAIQAAPVLRHMPAGIWDSLVAVQDELPSQQSVLLLTRHSQRESGHGRDHVGYQVPLTKQGERLALAWGRWLTAALNRPLHSAQASPVPRCLETARLMGASSVAAEPLWFDQASLVHDFQQAGPAFARYGPSQFLTRLLRHEAAGANLPTQIVGRLTALCVAAYQDLTTQGRPLLGVAVTHDLVLAVVIATLLGRTRVFEDDWPQMMEGAFMWFTGPTFGPATVAPTASVADGQLHLVWRGQKTTHSLGEWAEFLKRA